LKKYHPLVEKAEPWASLTALMLAIVALLISVFGVNVATNQLTFAVNSYNCQLIHNEAETLNRQQGTVTLAVLELNHDLNWSNSLLETKDKYLTQNYTISGRFKTQALRDLLKSGIVTNDDYIELILKIIGFKETANNSLDETFSAYIVIRDSEQSREFLKLSNSKMLNLIGQSSNGIHSVTSDLNNLKNILRHNIDKTNEKLVQNNC